MTAPTCTFTHRGVTCGLPVNNHGTLHVDGYAATRLDNMARGIPDHNAEVS
jgi:hypothetical protein